MMFIWFFFSGDIFFVEKVFRLLSLLRFCREFGTDSILFEDIFVKVKKTN